jgi:hypothetical protein
VLVADFDLLVADLELAGEEIVLAVEIPDYAGDADDLAGGEGLLEGVAEVGAYVDVERLLGTCHEEIEASGGPGGIFRDDFLDGRGEGGLVGRIPRFELGEALWRGCSLRGQGRGCRGTEENHAKSCNDYAAGFHFSCLRVGNFAEIRWARQVISNLIAMRVGNYGLSRGRRICTSAAAGNCL